MNELLNPTERMWLSWYGRLRVCGYIGTAADLYTRLTGRPHPKIEVIKQEVSMWEGDE